MQINQEKTNSEKAAIGDRINEFVQNNRKGIFIIICAVIFIFAGVVTYLYFGDLANKKTITQVEELNIKFQELNYLINDEFHTEEVQALLDELTTFAQKGTIFPTQTGFARSRAWSIIASIYSTKEDWQEAEEAWVNSARAGVKTYLTPIAYFNAAVAAEEQGKLEEAIEYLQKCLSGSFEFPAAPRAQFSIGRLNEQLGKFPEAIEAYRAVMINWPHITIMSNLARSRIIAIEIR